MSELEQLTSAALLASDGTAAGVRAAISALPWLNAAIRGDRAADRFSLWGRSRIIDENTGTAVIPRALFDELHDLAGIPAEWPVGNGGLLHCYGYLLSLEPTPYGLKRERWLGGALAEACGLSPDAFHPWHEGSSLLERATAAASGTLAAPASRSIQIVDGRDAHLALSAPQGPAALVYAVAPTQGTAPLLVTMFPVADAQALLAEFALPPAPPLRWNAA